MPKAQESRFRRFKRHIAATPVYRRAKLFLKRLVGQELRIAPEIDCEIREYGGWLLSPTGLDNGTIYSLGVGEDISFDLAMANDFHAMVHAFDPTPHSVAYVSSLQLPDNLSFHPWAVSGQDRMIKLYPRIKRSGKSDNVMMTIVGDADGEEDKAVVEVPGFSYKTILRKLGHEKIDLLKMDIEGAEYEVLEGILAERHKPKQLLIEFHHRFPQIGKQKTIGALNSLRAAGYKIAAVSHTGYEVSLILPGV